MSFGVTWAIVIFIVYYSVDAPIYVISTSNAYNPFVYGINFFYAFGEQNPDNA